MNNQDTTELRDFETQLRQDLGLLEWQIRDLIPLIQQHYAEREREAERRGEIAAMRLMVHHATLHGLRQQYDYGMHVLKSIEQFPDQPLASENLKALGLHSQLPTQKRDKEDV